MDKNIFKVDCQWDDEIVKFIVDYLVFLGFKKKAKPLDDHPECSWYDNFNIDYIMKFKDIDLHARVTTDYHHYINTCVSFNVDINDENEIIILRELNKINKRKANYGMINDNEVCIIATKEFNKKNNFNVGDEWKLSLYRCILEAKMVYFRMKYPDECEEEILLMVKGWR